MQASNYLGTERTGKLLLKFAIPCICSLIISCLYNIVDQIFVGNGVGYLGNAATGVIFPITVIGWGVSLFFGDGAAAALSVSLGKNETEHIHRSVGNSILCSFLGGVVIIAISYLWGDGLLRLIGATDANLTLAHDYGFIIYAMMPLALVQNTLASIIRADGSPKYAMGAMLVGAVLNIIGDPVAIFLLDLGIQGAAWATILGQFVSFCICAAYLTRSKTFRISAKSFRLDFTLLKQVMALGASSFLTQLSIVVITIVNNILLVKYGAASPYGEDIPLAAFVVIMKLFQIVLNIAIGIAAGAQPIVGFNYGAKRFARVRELLGLILKWTAIVCVVCTVLFQAFPQTFIQMFGAAGSEGSGAMDPELYIQFAVPCLRIYLSLILFTCVQKVCAILRQSRPGVIITIAREHGTAGKRIGQLVAQKLGIPCYYKEMTALAAQESGLAKEFISGINSDENAVMRELYLSTSAVQQAVIAQAKAINMIADMGSCVIIGRAADYVLRNRENVARIFIHAPKPYRVKKVMEMYGDTEQEGKKSIARSDSARGSYYKSISGHEWGDPHQYELTVDSSIGAAGTAELICDYVSHI